MSNQKNLTNPLTESYIKSLSHDGKKGHSYRIRDPRQAGLCISIQPVGTKSFVQIYNMHGKRKSIGLGPWPLVSLAKARELAWANKRLLREGKCPKRERDSVDKAPSFREIAKAVHEQKKKSLRSEKGAKLWWSRVEKYVLPKIGDMPVTHINVHDVKSFVKPLEQAGHSETAVKVRQNVAQVFDLAVENEHIISNPARKLKTERKTGESHAYVHHSLAREALAKALDSDAWIGSKLCFEWLVLTGERSSEARNATWGRDRP